MKKFLSRSGLMKTKFELFEALIEAEEAKNIALAANRAKSEFLANMSHELRTPLNAINGFSEIIMGGLVTDPEKIVEYAIDINTSGRHLLSLINDILDLAKVESGFVDLVVEQVALKPIIEVCARLVSEKVIKHGNVVTDSIDDDVIVVADRRRLKQVILNLLTNAAKFTKDGTIHVSCEQTDDYTNIVITDTGMGMDVDGLKQAMVKFGQVDGSLAREQEGTGLGLPLSKELVELHGGELTIESEVGVGTTVKVSLPRHQVVLPTATIKS